MEIVVMIGVAAMVVTNAYALYEVRRCYEIMQMLKEDQEVISDVQDKLILQHNRLCADIASSIKDGVFDEEDIFQDEYNELPPPRHLGVSYYGTRKEWR